jgi:Rrf2 family cysteine metabolism transcriptional repressor
MKLSTKMRYGSRAMLELALHYEDGVTSTREIAGEQAVSPKYLEHLLASLRSARLVRSVRGAQGGHSLTRPPAQINLREIYEALEGTEGFVPCTTCPEVCDRTQICATKEVWGRMFDACMAILESTTLEALARRVRNKQAAVDVMYYI